MVLLADSRMGSDAEVCKVAAGVVTEVSKRVGDVRAALLDELSARLRDVFNSGRGVSEPRKRRVTVVLPAAEDVVDASEESMDVLLLTAEAVVFAHNEA